MFFRRKGERREGKYRKLAERQSGTIAALREQRALLLHEINTLRRRIEQLEAEAVMRNLW